MLSRASECVAWAGKTRDSVVSFGFRNVVAKLVLATEGDKGFGFIVVFWLLSRWVCLVALLKKFFWMPCFGGWSCTF